MEEANTGTVSPRGCRGDRGRCHWPRHRGGSPQIRPFGCARSPPASGATFAAAGMLAPVSELHSPGRGPPGASMPRIIGVVAGLRTQCDRLKRRARHGLPHDADPRRRCGRRGPPGARRPSGRPARPWLGGGIRSVARGAGARAALEPADFLCFRYPGRSPSGSAPALGRDSRRLGKATSPAIRAGSRGQGTGLRSTTLRRASCGRTGASSGRCSARAPMFSPRKQ